MAWLSDWEHRIPITIDGTKVSESLTNFPVAIDLSASSGIGADDLTLVFTELESYANRKKIAVTGSDGTTQCPVEIHYWDHGVDAYLSAKIAFVSNGTDTTIYLYYDASQPDNTEYVGDTTETPAKSVWDSDFKAVYHVGTGVTGAAGVKDSTTNGLHLAAVNMESGDFDGLDANLDGVDERVGPLISALLQPSNTVTVESAVMADDTANPRTITQYGKGAGQSYGLIIGNPYTGTGPGKLEFAFYNGAWRTVVDPDAFPVGAMTYASGRYSGSALTVWVNGVEKASTSYSGSFDYTNLAGLLIGAYYAAGSYLHLFDGPVREVRVSGISRSDAWMKATSHSLLDTLMTYGDPEHRVIGDQMVSQTIMDSAIIMLKANPHEMSSMTVMDSPTLPSLVIQHSMFLVM